MATKVEPTMKYLRRFTAPLWDLIDLEDFKPVSIIEGERAGYAFVIFDMLHRDYGLMADNRKTTNTTFFMLRHKSTCQQPHITNVNQVKQYDAHLQFSVDPDFIYMAVPRKQIRPGEWEALLKLMMTLAEELAETASTDQRHLKRSAGYRPVGAGYFVHVFWMIVSVIVALMMLGFGLAGLFGLTKLAESWHESNIVSGQMLLASVFFSFGAVYSYHKAKKRR